MEARYVAARPPRFAEEAQVARRPRSRLVRHVALALTALALATLALAARADAFVYWVGHIDNPETTEALDPHMIGRANLDGTGVDRASSRSRGSSARWRSTPRTSTGRTS